MSSSDTLIDTKLRVPPLRSKMLNRPHLLAKLGSGKKHSVTIITGQAGSGKTSLIGQWIAASRLRTVWYSLDETDNDSDLFFRYLLAGLSRKDQELAEAIGPLLQNLNKLNGMEVVRSVLQQCIEMPRHLYLVLDDYHVITSNEIHQSLSYLMQYVPPKMHIIIASRYTLPFSLSQLKMRDRIIEISASDLRLTEEEGEAFLSEIVPLKLSPGEMKELTGYAEGWIGGLQLFGLSLKGKGDLQDLMGHYQGMYDTATDYLIDEVMNKQSKKIQSFLQQTAFLDRFDAGICREVTGLSDSAGLLDYVSRNNLFLVPLDSARKWYRYHHLFSQAIRNKHGISSPEMTRSIHQKAALCFAHSDHLEDAFRHAFASGDYEFAADLMEDYIHRFIEGYDIAGGLRWFSKLPREIFMRRALLRLSECAFKIATFEFADIEAALNAIDKNQLQELKRYEGAKRIRCEDSLIYYRYLLSYYKDPVNADIEELKAGFEKISHENKHLRGIVKIVIAGSCFYRGELHWHGRPWKMPGEQSSRRREL